MFNTYFLFKTIRITITPYYITIIYLEITTSITTSTNIDIILRKICFLVWSAAIHACHESTNYDHHSCKRFAQFCDFIIIGYGWISHIYISHDDVTIGKCLRRKYRILPRCGSKSVWRNWYIDVPPRTFMSGWQSQLRWICYWWS